ncbi:MAG: CcmD family protein [Chloroflexota bacterium]
MNLEYVFIAYALILFAIFAYVFSFTRKQRKLEREIDMLRRWVEGGKPD